MPCLKKRGSANVVDDVADNICQALPPPPPPPPPAEAMAAPALVP